MRMPYSASRLVLCSTASSTWPIPYSSTSPLLSGELLELLRSEAETVVSDVAVPVVGLMEVLTLAQDQVAGDMWLDADTPFEEAGLDSFSSIDLTNQLQHAIGNGMTLPYALLSEAPSARLVADYLSRGIAPIPLEGPASVESSDATDVDSPLPLNEPQFSTCEVAVPVARRTAWTCLALHGEAADAPLMKLIMRSMHWLDQLKPLLEVNTHTHSHAHVHAGVDVGVGVCPCTYVGVRVRPCSGW